MISKDDAVFTIGYDGDTAIVDGNAKNKFKKLDTKGLMEAGLYRSAFVSALYSNNDEEINQFANFFNSKANTNYETKEQFMRLFGVKLNEVKKVLVL